MENNTTLQLHQARAEQRKSAKMFERNTKEDPNNQLGTYRGREHRQNTKQTRGRNTATGKQEPISKVQTRQRAVRPAGSLTSTQRRRSPQGAGRPGWRQAGQKAAPGGAPRPTARVRAGRRAALSTYKGRAARPGRTMRASSPARSDPRRGQAAAPRRRRQGGRPARRGTHVLRVPLVDGRQRGASGHLVGRGAAPGALGKAARCRRPRPGGGGRPLSPPAAGRSGRAAGLLPAPLGARRHGLARRAAARLAAAGLRAARPPAPPPPPSCPLRWAAGGAGGPRRLLAASGGGGDSSLLPRLLPRAAFPGSLLLLLLPAPGPATQGAQGGAGGPGRRCRPRGAVSPGRRPGRPCAASEGPLGLPALGAAEEARGRRGGTARGVMPVRASLFLGKVDAQTLWRLVKACVSIWVKQVECECLWVSPSGAAIRSARPGSASLRPTRTDLKHSTDDLMCLKLETCTHFLSLRSC